MQPSPTPRSRLLPWWLVGFLPFVAAFVAYFPALPGELIWDDFFLVGSNPFFRSPLFLPEVFRHWLFPDALAVYYRPVQNISYLADYLLWRGEPFGYHFTNILLHGAAAVALFNLLVRLLPRFYAPPFLKSEYRNCENPSKPDATALLPALGVALIWAVHPVHNAAVAYISGRADSLAALFALSGWCLFLRGRERLGLPRILTFAAAWIFGLTALCSKEIAVTWLFLFAAVEVIPFLVGLPSLQSLSCLPAGQLDSGKAGRHFRLPLLCSLAAMLASYWFLRHLPEARHAPVVEAESIPARVLLMLRALGDYTRLLFWPANLHMCRAVSEVEAYASPAAWQRNIGYEYLSLLGALTLGIFGIGFQSQAPGQFVRRLGVLWFAIGFLPISNLFPLNAQVAEHWIYMPSAGFLLFILGCGLSQTKRWSCCPGAGRTVALAITLAAAIGFTLRTEERSRDWTTPERLYWSTLQNGGADPRVLVNFANTYSERGDMAGAEKVLRAVVAKYPTYTPARIRLGRLLLTAGKKAEAEPLLAAAEADPDAHLFAAPWMADLTLIKLKANEGKLDEALESADTAVKRNPAVAELQRAKVELLLKVGKPSEAAVIAGAMARSTWWDLPAQKLAAAAFFQSGDAESALAVLRQAAWLDVWATESLIMAAQIELRRGRGEGALTLCEKALARGPTASAYLVEASSLRQLGRNGEAESALKNAAELRSLNETPQPHARGEIR